VALLIGGMPFFQPAGVAHAAGPRLFFSEYVEGSGNNQALEIYNGTGAAVDLAAGGYNIQFYFDGSPTPGVTLNLTGKIADGDVCVVANAAAVAGILEQADQTFGGAWFDGNDAVVLRKGSVRLDVIGQIGFNPGTGWGSQWHSTADSTLRHPKTYCAGDPNGSDAFYPLGPWDTLATDTFDGLGTHSADCPSLPLPVPLLYAIGAVLLVVIAVGVNWFAQRKGVKLGIYGTFLMWLAGTAVLMPIAEFLAGRVDMRTMALVATAELAIISLVSGFIVGWRQSNRTEGALSWIGVIIVGYVAVVLSFSEYNLAQSPSFSGLRAVLLSLALYQAAFFLIHYLRHQRHGG
jgi:hypothetical protein